MTNFRLGFLLFITFLGVSLHAQDTIPLKNGLVIGATNKGDRSIIYTDPVFHNFITKTNYEPIVNDSVGIGRQDNVERWEPLTTDEKGVFKSRKLRGGYLYVTYNAPISEIKILEISGHNEVFVNGIPRGGDVYNKHLTFHPIELLKGKNTFLVRGGRGEVFMQLLSVEKPIALLERDMTNPDFLTTESDIKIGSIRILNSTAKTLKNLKIVAESQGKTLETKVSSIVPLSMRKVPYQVKDNYTEKDTVRVKIQLYEGSKLIDEASVLYQVRTPEERYSRTFISNIDGSVQYFSVKEGDLKTDEKPAMFLSVHGANVEAKNQAVQYQAKDWGHVIAPTNRRDYGFNWEDWGRWDAMEVQELTEKMYGTDPKRTYLTGHSMGGHGTWHLGAIFPNKWAAIAPISGWYSLFSYANKEEVEKPTPLENMFVRSNHASHTLELSRNYLHHGVYIQHGDADEVVPVDQARFMRKHLAEFHPDFAYLEYEDKKHWFGIDFHTIFDYFKWHTIPENGDVKTFEFRTPNPGVSSESRYVTLYQQEKLFEFSGVKATQNIRTEKQIKNHEDLKTRTISLETENLKKFKLDLKHTIASDTVQVKIDSTSFENLVAYKGKEVWFEKVNGTWSLTKAPTNTFEKNPSRYGNFKEAFKNNMLFVYGTKGNDAENNWAFNKARFDAETFYYRGNGSTDIISDKEFSLKKYKDRSVILYGNASTNSAWKLLLAKSPVQVKRNEVTVGSKILKGDDYGVYLTYPRIDSKTASVAAITGTGLKGFEATIPNKYFGSGTDIPDVMIFTNAIYANGIESVKAVGYFGNDWSLEHGEIEWGN
ncbi:prolyl oligopeptidase family serine peptidase [Mariniflexile gromovii]|uniref:Prolyl oligopeptidase family serine peptidase n=1 Tax=Mariniflexile gromovii TaxID=362523 RepID=A0ABS4BQX7_9FLAO|nr:prolyl oligopeptidase family serine peptidase [Mariniflexile gromovii]MBP0902984.1 prolyl oligopeptidase family serine peptidase [Mariniflexile gromovii]